MSSVIIFGAGNNCRRLLSSSYLRDFDMQPLFVVDNDCTKWDKKVLGIEIKPPESIKKSVCDYILICIEKWEEAYIFLVDNCLATENMILTCDFFRNRILDVKERKKISTQAQITMLNAEKTIMYDLLVEAWRDGEFVNCDKICIVDGDRYVEQFRYFFEVMKKQIDVYCYNGLVDGSQHIKYVIVTSDFLEKQREFIKKGVEKKQLLVLPLCDIKESMGVHL